jgi:hypothetical protein
VPGIARKSAEMDAKGIGFKSTLSAGKGMARTEVTEGLEVILGCSMDCGEARLKSGVRRSVNNCENPP